MIFLDILAVIFSFPYNQISYVYYHTPLLFDGSKHDGQFWKMVRDYTISVKMSPSDPRSSTIDAIGTTNQSTGILFLFFFEWWRCMETLCCRYPTVMIGVLTKHILCEICLVNRTSNYTNALEWYHLIKSYKSPFGINMVLTLLKQLYPQWFLIWIWMTNQSRDFTSFSSNDHSWCIFDYMLGTWLNIIMSPIFTQYWCVCVIAIK